jgi:diguanylate cyclase (GGDEF)-like protein
MRAQVLAGVDSAPVRDHQMIRSDGERVLVEQSIGLLRDDRGRASGYVSQFVDVTEARAARDQLRFLATHDSMTALFNRHELVSRISGILSKRPRTGINVGVLFIDLDGLKPVNDTYGHAVGDAVIVTVADRIRSRVRSDDVLARFGGDEFVLVLPAIHTVGNAERIAASLHEVVAAPMEIEGHSIVMTLSIGVALVEPGDNADAALRQADAALYRAKRQGKACTVIYDPAWEG